MRNSLYATLAAGLLAVVLAGYRWGLPSRASSCAQLGNDIGAIATITDGRCKIGDIPIEFAYAIRGGDPRMDLSPTDLINSAPPRTRP